MPLPLFLGIGAAISGAIGVGASVHGIAKMKEAQDTMQLAKSRHAGNMARFEKLNTETCAEVDKLGKKELEILHSFGSFADIFEQIHNRPQFIQYTKDGVEVPKYDGEKLKEVSVGAGVLLGGLGGAAVGTAGGFAAAGATTAAVMALGTASTGTAIASLSGAALTNATLAALGGGAIAAGGGGMALGSLVLGGATLGVGLLVGGMLFNVTGGKLSDKADEAYSQMKDAEREINKIRVYLNDLSSTSARYYHTLNLVNEIYQKNLNGLTTIVTMLGHKDYESFTDSEKMITENTVLLVNLLYKMCQVQLVLKDESDVARVNTHAITKAQDEAKFVLREHNLGEISDKMSAGDERVPGQSKRFTIKVKSVSKINNEEYYADVQINHAPIRVGNVCWSAKHEEFRIIEIVDNGVPVELANENTIVRVRLKTNGPGELEGRTLFRKI